ncbi:hypothetical protein TNCV_4659451 [Trichonephila clavipes]|nr:hypothetical protein TNCV_4659451 [Trichonephila clavipes]
MLTYLIKFKGNSNWFKVDSFLDGPVTRIYEEFPTNENILLRNFWASKSRYFTAIPLNKKLDLQIGFAYIVEVYKTRRLEGKGAEVAENSAVTITGRLDKEEAYQRDFFSVLSSEPVVVV